jgi:hypothetical protein
MTHLQLSAWQVTSLLELVVKQEGKTPRYLANYYGVCEKHGALCIVMDLYPGSLSSAIPPGACDIGLFNLISNCQMPLVQEACPQSRLFGTQPKSPKAWRTYTTTECGT